MSTGPDRKPPARPSLPPRPSMPTGPTSGTVPARVNSLAPRPSIAPGPARPAGASERPGTGLVRGATVNAPLAARTGQTPKPSGTVAQVDPAIDAICKAFEQHLPVLLADPFARNGSVFSRAAGPAALSAQYVVRFARRSPEPQRGPAVELVLTGSARVPHARIGQVQRILAARKVAADDPLRGLRPYFGESEARLVLPFEVSIDEPEITSMAAAAKLSSLVELLDPILGKVTL